MGRAPARVLVQGRTLTRERSAGGVSASSCEGLLSALLEVSGGDYEALVIELDAADGALLRELVSALRERPTTRAVALIGVSRSVAKRNHFLASGGDLALAGPSRHVADAIRWLTGASREIPRGAFVAHASDATTRKG